MLFNSIDFAIFLPTVFILYWLVDRWSLRLQNMLLVLASYVFYGWWDWRFLSLIIISTLVDFTVGWQLSRSGEKKIRRILLWTSIVVNIGLLGFFKYYNFFVENFVQAFTFMGADIRAGTLHIILPVGISFYTFQTLSYTIDVYRNKLEPSRDILAFAAFVSFFPQLVAGPIERATRLLPQCTGKRIFNYERAVDGLRQMLWGFFKKIVIADTCAIYVNEIFGNYAEYSGSTLVMGAVFFAFQIYGDFSGYSDIAIGAARLFGFNLNRNFAFPYFSRDMAEFWRRWHISLSTWFRDYLYIPLGGSRGSSWLKVRNVFIIFLVSGFWHGANWTFLAWGALNALYFIPLMPGKRHRLNLDTVASDRLLPGFRELMGIFLTFALTTLAWIFFRSESLMDAFAYLGGILDPSLLSIPVILPKSFMLIIFFFMLVEWLQRDKQHGLQFETAGHPRFLRWAAYMGVLLLIYFFGNFTEPSEFLYFQF